MNYMPFNSISGDRVYKAEDWAWYFSTFISNGVFAPYNGHTACNVNASGTMGLTVDEGFAFINGYAFHNTGANLTVSTAHAALPRIDRVVVRWDLNNRLMLIALKKGTAASNPSAPALTRSSTIYELALADIYVDAGATGISQAKVTDRRSDTSLCGFVTGVIDQIDWTSLTAQLRSYMATFQADLEAYIATLHGILDTQTASHLLNLIQTLEAEVDDHYGSGAGAANSHVYKDDITTITADMWSSIANGTFDGIHVGMHYTAASGRSYWFADADYFYRHRLRVNGTYQTVTDHHILVVEDEINHQAKQNNTDSTQQGCVASTMFTTTLPGIQSELETDFGASHILTVPIVVPFNYTVSNATATTANIMADVFLLNTAMVWGSFMLSHPDNSDETYPLEWYCSNRSRQLSLFRGLPDAIVAPYNGNDYSAYWLDDIVSEERYGSVDNCLPTNRRASSTAGIRRAFVIKGA